jgi:eukaryotic-like serine/threonine-protein kinase
MKLPTRWKELSPLFDELIELEHPARDARLQDLREQDLELADELASMLRIAIRADEDGFLAHRRPVDATAGLGLMGKKIGAHVIEGELGEGGHGSVWRARRADGRFDGVVAIKLLHLSLLGPTGAARFQREGALLSRLTHPNIARLLDAGVTPEGQPYLVLEYVDGTPIDQHCDQQRLDIDKRLRLLREVMDSVMHAHGQLIVHRDIKPNNILVTAEGQVKLLDFGIAKLLDDDREDAALTIDGQRVLTPRYAAPEQLEGAPLTTATDVYALGVLMYRLLTGRHPTALDTASTPEVIQGALTTEPVRLSSVLQRTEPAAADNAEEIAAKRGTTAKGLRRQLRGDLDAIVSRALRKLPAERYQSVADFASDIDRYLRDLPVSAHYPSAGYRLGKFLRRNRGGVIASALVIASIVAGLVGTMTQAHRAERERDSALHQLKSAEASGEFIQFLMSEGSGDRPVAPELLGRAEQLIESEFAKDPEQQARLQLLLAGLYGEATLQIKAENLLLRAQQNARGLADVNLNAQIQCQLALQLADNGRGDQSRRMLDAAIETLQASSLTDPARLATCFFERSEINRFFGDLQAALADAKRALSTLGEPRPDQRTDAIKFQTQVASMEAKLGQSAAAARQYQRALDDLDAMGRGQTEMATTENNNFGVLLNNAGRPLEAAKAFKKATEVARQVGHADPIAEGNYARVLIDLGQPREAMRLTEDALASLTGVANREIGATMSFFGAPAWCAVGDLARCESLIRHAQEVFASTPPHDKAVPGALLMRAAQLDAQKGDLRAARDEMRRAVADFEVLRHRNLMKALALLARLDLKMGEMHDAQAHAAQAVTLARSRMEGFEHTAWVGSALLSQGLVQQALGDDAAARRTLGSALAELRDAAGDDAPETVEARKALALLKA